jgi:hypothetical protein
LKLVDGFENTPVGAKPGMAHTTKKDPTGSIKVVTEQPSKGARCLQLTDGPQIEPAFEPHFYYRTNVEKGTARVAFDVRAEPAYQLTHEWRDESNPYQSGPKLDLQKGVLTANGKKLADLPPDGWTHVEVTARIGEGSDGTWTCTLTLPGGKPQRFEGLKFVKPAMKGLKWIGWASNGKAAAKCWIDEIEIGTAAP